MIRFAINVRLGLVHSKAVIPTQQKEASRGVQIVSSRTMVIDVNILIPIRVELKLMKA